MKVLIIGAINFDDEQYVRDHLDRLIKLHNIREIVLIGSFHVEHIAMEVASEFNVKITRYRYYWMRFCPAAKNQHREVLDIEKPRSVFIFNRPGDRRTRDMYWQADAALHDKRGVEFIANYGKW